MNEYHQLGGLLEQRAAERGDTVYLYWQDEEVSYATLDRRVNQVAHGLRGLGAGSGQKVALLLRNCPEFLYAFFACAKLGAVAVPINPQLKRDEIHYILAQRREQFGRPIGRFQLVQDLLVRMLGNITASQCMVVRLSQLQDAGVLQDEHAALAKAFCTVKMRETVGYARELLGGNGILLEENVGRFVADAEAIYSYEGTREINTLIVGRAITGLSTFV